MEGLKFKHLRITRASSGFSFAWQESEVTEPLAAVPDLQKGHRVVACRSEKPTAYKTLIEFTLWVEENNWDYEAVCEKSASDGEVSA
jgi:hypothetical protein